MKKISYVVTNPLGVHARPCALLAQCCVNFKSYITVKSNEATADSRNVLELLSLRLKKGDVMEVFIEGIDEEEAYAAVMNVINREFNERKESKILKIAFYGTKDYDRTFFSELTKDKGHGTYNSEIKYFASNLSVETASLSKGYDAVCVFVNDDVSRPVIEQLHDNQVKLVLLRCAGFNNVDLVAVTTAEFSEFKLAFANSIYQLQKSSHTKLYKSVPTEANSYLSIFVLTFAIVSFILDKIQ